MEYINIGGISIERTAALAPMASVADKSYRLLCREFGAAYMVSEMISSKGLCYGDKKTGELCEIEPQERPYALQLFGEDPYFMGKAAYLLGQYKPDIIDINMGCPVPKIVGNGSGSALMRDIPRAVEIAKETVKNASCPVTVKFRAGWDDSSRNAVEFAEALEQTGIAAMAVHGRTRQQFYSGEADRGIIRMVKEAVSIPVFGNGDVSDGESCRRMYEETGCDLVMLARGSYGRPWVFREIKHFLETGETLPEPTVRERMEIMLRHCAYLCKYKGETRGMKEARKNVSWYVKGLPNSSKLRAECGELSSYAQAEEMAARIIRSAQE